MTEELIWNFKLATKNPLDISALGVCEREDIKWETRFFWPGNESIIINNLNNSLLDLRHYKHKRKEDYYYLLPGENYNIKLRRNKLVYKPIVKHSSLATGFAPKIDLENPDEYPQSINSVFLQKLLRETRENAKSVFVKKESFSVKFPTTPSVKLELARLEVNNRTYFSVCVEGASLYLVETIGKHLLGRQVSCDYVSFLKNIIR